MVPDALEAGQAGSAAAGEQVRPRPPRLLLLAPLVGLLSPAPAPRAASRTRRRADSSPSRAGRFRRTGGKACRAAPVLAVDLERFISVLVRPSCSLFSCHRLEHALLRLCEPYELRADLLCLARRSVEPSMAPSSVLVSKARLFAGRPPLDGAGRCSSCLFRKQSDPGCPESSSRRPHSSRRPSTLRRQGRVLPRPYPPSRAPEGRGYTLVCRSHGHRPCGATVRPATS